MAELSAETKAIIDRLKAEGDLIRNSGTNSIRSVKIQLDRFEGVFNTISANVVEQTKILQMQAGLAQEAVEAQRTREQLDELKQEEEKKSRIDNDESRRKTDENIDRIADSLRNAFSLKNIALAGAGLFVGYNLLKGFIDERTDGGFSRMEEAIANTDFAGLTTMVNALTSIDWQGFADIMNKLIQTVQDFDEWLIALPGIILGGNLFRQGIRGMVQGALDSRNGPRVGPTRSNAAGGQARGLGALRATILGAVTALAWAYGDEVEQYLRDQMGMNPDVAGLTVDVARYGLTAAAGAATIASMFGMTIGAPGLILAAAAGVAFVLGRSIYNWFQEQERLAAEAMARRLADLTAIFNFDPESGTTQDVIGPQGAVVPGISAQEGLARAQSSGLVTEEALEAARTGDAAAIEEVRAGIREAVVQRQRDFAGAWYTDLRNEIENLEDTYLENESDRVARIIDVMEGLRQNFELTGDEYWAASFNSMLGPIRRHFSGYNLDELREGGAHPSHINLFQWLAENEQNRLSFRSGTRGFQDFGDGSFAVLHGREAVVPFNTAAGHFLDQYFTENWQPKAANTERIARVAVVVNGGSVVINAPTNVSPVFNNVEGGKSVNQVSIRGGGGMPSLSSNPYGLPGLAN